MKGKIEVTISNALTGALKTHKLGVQYSLCSTDEHDIEMRSRDGNTFYCAVTLGSQFGQPCYRLKTEYGYFFRETFPTIRAALDYYIDRCRRDNDPAYYTRFQTAALS